MAKLEDQVTPSEMLDIIRDGALKNEIIKRFRTSEQELAMMLLPLYRSGTLSKEEFNDFFKGVALRKPEEPPTGKEDEPPSAIFKALTDVHDRKVIEAAIKAAEEEEKKQPPAKEAPAKAAALKQPANKEPKEAAEKKPPAKEEPAPTEIVSEPVAPPDTLEAMVAAEAEEMIAGEDSLGEEELLEESEIFEDLDVIAEPVIEVEPAESPVAEKVPAEPVEHAAPGLEIAPPPPPDPTPVAEVAVKEARPVPATSPEPPAVKVSEPVAAPAPPPAPATAPAPPVPAGGVSSVPLLKAQGGKTIDSAGMTSFLEMIFAKLSTIESRLAQIEKKVGGS